MLVLNHHQMAQNPPLLLCIFKDCLFKANLLNKLHLLEMNLLLLGSVEFNALGKKELYFNVFFSISAVNVI